MLRMIHERWQQGELGLIQSANSAHAAWVQKHYDSQVNCAVIAAEIGNRGMALQTDASLAYGRGSRRELQALVKEVLDKTEDDVTSLDWVIFECREASRVGHNVIGAKMKWAKSNATLDVLRICRSLGWEDVNGLQLRKVE